MREPLISVVMPVFNGGDYLIEAVASIVEQSMADWELICINDGSTDNSLQVLEWFAWQDPRIRVVDQPNRGIVAALNGGCAIAKAPLICRMDCDDISLPDRLEQQATFMRSNPGCTAVGGAILEIDQAGDPLHVARLPSKHAAILNNLLHRKTGLFHPTTLIRAEALEAVNGYRSKYQWVEDHDLWLRLALRGELANIDTPLLCYRQHAGSVCWQRSSQQRELMNDLLQEAYRIRNLELPDYLLLGAGTPRTPAGPGKWARLAARGGYVSSTFKHLQLLLQSDAPWSYKSRMLVECSLRLSGRRMIDAFTRRPQPVVPSFEAWKEQIARDLYPERQSRAAA